MKEIAGLKYRPEKDLAKEGIKKVGVGLFIIDLATQKLWVVEEKCPKNSTGRESGDISLPLETRKTGEYILDNVAGALAEFRQLCPGEELVYLNGHSYKGRYELIEGVVADIVMLGLRHRRSEEIWAIDSREVSPRGWMSVPELSNQPNLRRGVDGFLKTAMIHNWVGQFVQAIEGQTGPELVMTGNTCLSQIFLERETEPDY